MIKELLAEIEETCRMYDMQANLIVVDNTNRDMKEAYTDESVRLDNVINKLADK